MGLQDLFIERSTGECMQEETQLEIGAAIVGVSRYIEQQDLDLASYKTDPGVRDAVKTSFVKFARINNLDVGVNLLEPSSRSVFHFYLMYFNDFGQSLDCDERNPKVYLEFFEYNSPTADEMSIVKYPIENYEEG